MWALGMIICVVLGFLIGFYTCTLMVTRDRKELKRTFEVMLEKNRKSGKWVHVNSNSFKCSICGNFLNFRGVNAGRGGAKMEVDK